jgi:hypothetical protein
MLWIRNARPVTEAESDLMAALAQRAEERAASALTRYPHNKASNTVLNTTHTLAQTVAGRPGLSAGRLPGDFRVDTAFGLG